MIDPGISTDSRYTRVDQKRGTGVQVVWGWEYGTGHFDGGGWVAWHRSISTAEGGWWW